MNNLSGFSLNNYKSFLKATGGASVECRPITLFYGRNHAGKSALLRGLGFVASSLSGTRNQRLRDRSLLNFSFPALGSATFDDLMSRARGLVGQPIEFSLKFDGPGEVESLLMRWAIRRMNDNSRLIVDNFEARSGEESILAEYSPDDQGNDAHLFRYSGIVETETRKHALESLLPDLGRSPHGAKWQQRFDELAIPTIKWLSSSRAPAVRSFALAPSLPDIGPDGAGYEQVIASSIEHSATSPLLDQISQWLSHHLRLKLEVRRNSNYRELVCHSINEPLAWVNLADAGQGVQELVPLLTLLFMKRDTPSVLLIEEPESHLHSNLHAGLGELFSQHVIQNTESLLVVETHSENLLLSLQLQIAEGKLPPENLVVYWTRWLSEGFSQVDQITFDALGKPKGSWPPGVFTEDIAQARRLLQIQKQKGLNQ